MSALTPRTWAVHDRVAMVHAGRWVLGDVCRVGDFVHVRWGHTTTTTSLPLDDQRLVHEHEVPVDERHWLPESVRDQLVRQEAAGRLRAMGYEIPRHWAYTSEALADLAEDLDDVVGKPNPVFARIARALLAPVPALTSP